LRQKTASKGQKATFEKEFIVNLLEIIDIFLRKFHTPAYWQALNLAWYRAGRRSQQQAGTPLGMDLVGQSPQMGQ
jgi:hypothetical protein